MTPSWSKNLAEDLAVEEYKAAIRAQPDQAARRYVEHDTTAQETFGELASVRGKLEWIGGLGAPIEVGAVPAANDNVHVVRVAMDNPDAFVVLPPGYTFKPFVPEDNAKRAAYITTYTGRFYPFAPRASDVRIEDIAHSLSMQCRYAGHGKRFYSVAEHSVHVARWLSGCGPHTALTALLHDATEAYLVDVPRPIKAHLAGYKEVEAAVWLAIAEAFDLDRELPTVVHIADSRIVADEMSQNLHEVDPAYTDPLGINLEFWMPWAAELYFLDTFKKLTAAIEAENMRAA